MIRLCPYNTVVLSVLSYFHFGCKIWAENWHANSIVGPPETPKHLRTKTITTLGVNIEHSYTCHSSSEESLSPPQLAGRATAIMGKWWHLLSANMRIIKNPSVLNPHHPPFFFFFINILLNALTLLAIWNSSLNTASCSLVGSLARGTFMHQNIGLH